MKHLSFILMLLLLIGRASAREERAGPGTDATDSAEETAVADRNADVVAASGARESDTTNLVENVESTSHTADDGTVLMGLRDPFWPVGYEPPPPEPEVSGDEMIAPRIEAVERKINWPTLRLKGITRAGTDRYMAIIGGIGLVESGQTVSIRQGDMLYSWRIEAVTAKGVDFTRLEARPYQLPTIGVRTQ